jgi:methylated-DNA-protein-cysteine methyltransferase-like protein
MVGWAMNQSHNVLKSLPAHRVVNRKGLLTGKAHFGGQEVMKQLLENEGFIIENDQIINFFERFWNPSDEITNDLG